MESNPFLRPIRCGPELNDFFAETGISISRLCKLFALHVRRTGMNLGDGWLSASDEMRMYLANLMGRTIRRDAKALEEEFQDDASVLRQIPDVIRRMIDNIYHPDSQDLGLLLDEQGEPVARIFNPNAFRYADFHMLIYTAHQ